jgi:hypothetical protein
MMRTSNLPERRGMLVGRIFLFFVGWLCSVDGFPLSAFSTTKRLSFSAFVGNNNVDQEGPEKSRMPGFIRRFLDGDKHDDQQYTHLIAIPVDACHELLLELESVQRAILYHCPVLVHACITPAVTRLPLLYVRSDSANMSTSATLHRILQRVVEEHTFRSASVDEEGSGGLLSSANAEGIEPWLIPFQGLEVDGTNHQVLSTVGTTGGSARLQAFVQDLQDSIEKETKWETSLPSDSQQPDQFRLPFMRLPENWETILRQEHQNKETSKESEEDDDDDDDDDFLLFLTSDQGGNGISPLFWAQWMDDSFGGGETRMREVAVYRRRQASDSNPQEEQENEQAFYLPELSVPLPQGNATLSKQEGNSEAYQEERMREAEQALKEDKPSAVEALQSKNNEVDEKDIMLTKTRERLESLYSSSSLLDQDESSVEEELESKITRDEDKSPSGFNKNAEATTEDPSALDDFARQRIQKAVASRARVQSEKELARKKVKPPIAENSIFQQYKDGTLVPEQPKALPTKQEQLPPFPSREHCTGFWRVVRSPTGFSVEDGTEDSSRTDNLILRVDGTIAGGPILDQETRQKASGGTWRLLVAKEDDGGDGSATLRVRLVIPPLKERILVMQGKLEKVSVSSTDLPMASSTFGIPFLEERRAMASTNELDDLLYCSGDVWIEDSTTGLNRDDIGNFSLMKLNVPSDPSEFTITIPRPVRNQD